MKISDFLTGIIFIISGSCIVVEARSFPTITGQPYGSAFFPTLIGAAMICGGLVLSIGAIVKRGVFPLLSIPDWLKSFRGIGSFGIIFLTLGFYMIFVEYLGFCVTAFCMLLVIQKWMGAKLIPASVISVVATSVFYVVFAVLLRVPLSHGVVERLFS